MSEKQLSKSEEIQQLKQNITTTKRDVSEELEAILYDELPLLDHGFIRVIDYMGVDSSITQAARVSYGKGTKTVQNDKMLIRYLMKHHHTSPFEMCEIKLHIKAPIFVARQWVRHRTANINEYSGRYSLMSDDFYIPEPQYVTSQSTDNKQGRGNILKDSYNKQAIEDLTNISKQSFKVYGDLLNNEAGEEHSLARELARIVLPLNSYTEFYWKIDLHNLLHFLNLRAHPHAQYEIRVYADLLLDIIKKWVPITYQAFIDYKKDAINLSREANLVVKKLLSTKEMIVKSDYSLSKREWSELLDVYGETIKERLLEK
ncbi:FAD-dependent thymidylate synthase [Rickettsiales bacterium LUAb2]